MSTTIHRLNLGLDVIGVPRREPIFDRQATRNVLNGFIDTLDLVALEQLIYIASAMQLRQDVEQKRIEQEMAVAA